MKFKSNATSFLRAKSYLLENSEFSFFKHLLTLFLCLLLMVVASKTYSQNKHSKTSNFPSYNGLLMAGYQGWFRAAGDGANRGWQHYNANGKFDRANIMQLGQFHNFECFICFIVLDSLTYICLLLLKTVSCTVGILPSWRIQI